MDKLETYWKDAAIPAFNRLGIDLIGVFKPEFGAHGSDLFVIIPHDSLESYSGAWDKITADDEIRNIDPKRIVVIGGNQWFGASEIPAVWTNLDEVGAGEDEFLMATFHHYDPWEFTGDNQGDNADQWTDENIDSPMKTMQAWAQSVGNDMPIYIGEWGTGWGSRYNAMNCNNIRFWYEKFDAQYARSYGMPTTVWDDGGWFKIYDHGTNEFANNLHLCIINGDCDWQGTERFNSECN
jgi:endoglucanase